MPNLHFLCAFRFLRDTFVFTRGTLTGAFSHMTTQQSRWISCGKPGMWNSKSLFLYPPFLGHVIPSCFSCFVFPSVLLLLTPESWLYNPRATATASVCKDVSLCPCQLAKNTHVSVRAAKRPIASKWIHIMMWMMNVWIHMRTWSQLLQIHTCWEKNSEMWIFSSFCSPLWVNQIHFENNH